MRYPTCLLVLLLSVILADSCYGRPTFDFETAYANTPKYRDCPLEVKEACEGKTDTYYCKTGLRLSVHYVYASGVPPLAIVEGTSCLSGADGLDIHDIYGFVDPHHVTKIELPETDVQSMGKLFFQWNYDVMWDKGQLVEIYNDTSERINPLVIRYQWNGRWFQIASIVASPMYKTSYDCSITKEDYALAICYVQELADLDVKLGNMYQKALAKLPKKQKATLTEEESQWLHQRNKNCPIQKWWVECLKDEFDKRIAYFQSIKH